MCFKSLGGKKKKLMQASGDHPIKCLQVVWSILKWGGPCPRSVYTSRRRTRWKTNRFRQIHGHFPVCVFYFFFTNCVWLFFKRLKKATVFLHTKQTSIAFLIKLREQAVKWINSLDGLELACPISCFILVKKILRHPLYPKKINLAA